MGLAGCPYNCDTKYKVWDSRAGKSVPCPYCSERVKEELATGFTPDGKATLGEQYHINHPVFNWDRVFMQGALALYDSEKVEGVRTTIIDLIDLLRTGKLTWSVAIGIKSKGHPEEVIEPLLAAALQGNKSIPSVQGWCKTPDGEWARKGIIPTALDFIQDKMKNDTENLQEYYSSDIVVMNMNTKQTEDIKLIKGLLELRASRGLPTVLVTTLEARDLVYLLKWSGDEVSLEQCDPYFLSNSRDSEIMDDYTSLVFDEFLEA